jgi:hypothetical protein
VFSRSHRDESCQCRALGLAHAAVSPSGLLSEEWPCIDEVRPGIAFARFESSLSGLQQPPQSDLRNGAIANPGRVPDDEEQQDVILDVIR